MELKDSRIYRVVGSLPVGRLLWDNAGKLSLIDIGRVIIATP